MENNKGSVIKHLVVGGFFASLLSFSITLPALVLTKKHKCELEEPHEHLFVTKTGIKAYFNSERHDYDRFIKHDEIRLIDKKYSKLEEFIQKEALAKLEDNEKFIKKNAIGDKRRVEYEYNDYIEKEVEVTDEEGNVKKEKETVREHGWDTDPKKHDTYTGHARNVYETYTVYKITTNEEGDYQLEECPETSDLSDEEVRKNCPYIKSAYRVIHFAEYIVPYSERSIFDKEASVEEPTNDNVVVEEETNEDEKVLSK